MSTPNQPHSQPSDSSSAPLYQDSLLPGDQSALNASVTLAEFRLWMSDRLSDLRGRPSMETLVRHASSGRLVAAHRGDAKKNKAKRPRPLYSARGLLEHYGLLDQAMELLQGLAAEDAAMKEASAKDVVVKDVAAKDATKDVGTDEAANEADKGDSARSYLSQREPALEDAAGDMPMYLSEMAAWLRRFLPAGPSIATLRRHAAAGALQGCRAEPVAGPGHAKYLLPLVLKHYGLGAVASGLMVEAEALKRLGVHGGQDGESGAEAGREILAATPESMSAPVIESATNPAPESTSESVPEPEARPDVPAEVSVDLSPVMQMMQSMLEMQQETLKLITGMGDMARAAQDLSSTRSTLMLKYDAQAQALRERVEVLQDALRRAAPANDMTLPLARIERALRNIESRMPSLGE